MNKVCFLCPIYDTGRHFEYGLNLVQSMADLKIDEDIHFIFSNVSQKDKFLRLTKERCSKDIKWMIVPEEINSYKAVVVAKKLYGLEKLQNEYDYIALVDCESLFVNKTDFSTLFEEIDNKKLCLNSNISYDGFFLLRRCFKTIGLYRNKKLRKEFRNFKYNFWFNEIQVYNTKKLPCFFKWLEQFDKAYLSEWACFEYYLYGAYLILEEGEHLNRFPSLRSMGGIMEYMPNYKKEKQIKIIKKLGTHWTSSKDSIINSTYILFHLDRTGKKEYGYKDSAFRLKIKRLLILLLNK